MGLANTLTISRIVLVPLCMLFLLVHIPYGYIVAAVIFSLAALTDSIDGYIARRRKEVTKFGIFLDPLADKLLVTSALVSLVELHWVPAWIVVIILAREFAVTGLRALKAEEGQVVPASKWGKIKTVVQIVAVVVVMLTPIYKSLISWPIGDYLMYLAATVTVLSGIEYFVRLSK